MSQSGHRGKRWQKPDDGSGGLHDFGWAPKNQPPAHSQDRYGPISQHYSTQSNQPPPFMQPAHQRQRQRPVPASHHVQQQQHPSYAPQIPTAEYHAPPTQTLNQEDAGSTRRPAWMGTLKSGHVLKPWEQDPVVAQQQANYEHQPQQNYVPPSIPSGPGEHVPIHQPRVQTVHYAPGHAPQYKPDAPQTPSDTARVVHLQYNSPIGLYSTGNVKDTLHGQVHGKPGEGTMQVQGPPKEFDPSKSAVLKFMNQEAQQPKRRPVHHEPPSRAPPPQQQEPVGVSDF